ncbi:APN2 DNA lyase apurinic/apyrimidinic [Teratosphaeria nubilosa]|uniref:DNA-(apurinic or apyrimidinic site) endonuclease 2 n=1 Tax=Teratosphaeria nubilosa TaxID=161662 RepID=A0A6G1KUW0_9PEZI|nr:APN2 DNA lyase apurinic/apyrimidinic [Teratosphaeria nubilosa]
MRLTTWNVNGIRNPFSYPPWNTERTFPAMFDGLGSDIVVMQELKIQRKDLRDDMVLLDGWDCFFSLPKHKKGYSGVGIYTRSSTCAPIRAEEGLLGVLPSPSGVSFCELAEGASIGGYPTALQTAELGVDPALLDAEGRCLVVEFPAFVLLGVYSPANSNGLRDDFRYGFICALDCRIRNLIKNGKNVVLVGDLNVSRDEMDTASAVEDMRKAGISHEEYISTPNRRIFNQLLLDGEVAGEHDEGRERGVLWDTTRAFHPERKGMYTHWEQKINARPGNFGSRIDFVLVCESMLGWVKDANIQEGLHGSDHCPVYADFKDEVEFDGKRCKLIDLMNPPNTFSDGVRLKDWKLQDSPAFSAKRMPEFDRRRSIKSMFAAPSLKKAQSSATTVPTSAAPVLPSGEAVPSPSPVKSGTDTPGATPLKRKASAIATQSKPIKKQNTSADFPKSKGQQSLKGFFQKATPGAGPPEKTMPQSPGSSEDAAVDPPSRNQSKVVSSNDSVKITSMNLNGAPESPDHLPNTSTNHESHPDDVLTPASTMEAPDEDLNVSPSQFSAKLEAVEQNQKSWNSLFARPVAPLCEGHNEPCKSMLTKKKGSNQGRSFWMCARPLGPSGNKERGTQWRCPTFIWCSDWQGRKVEEQVVEPG